MLKVNLKIILSLFAIILFQTIVHSQDERIVEIETTLGNIKIKLYNETPLHRDNFVKLAEEHFFDSLLFHRVINEFMIQGGDPDSKNAAPGARLGNGGPGYEIPAEFNLNLFHKKGVLAAAREGDQINPKKKSSGSQFYIVLGKVLSDSILNIMEARINDRNKQVFIRKFLQKPENKYLRDSLTAIQKGRDQETFNNYILEIEKAAMSELKNKHPFKFTMEQRKAYTSIGGTPHLDGSYTVFGEVIDGIEVLDKIAVVKTDQNDRPLEDIQMKIRLIK